MTETEKKLWDAAKTGQYPPGTTAQDLANVKNIDGRSALHIAATSNHYPPGTTAQNLADTKDQDDYSTLHIAASYGHFPPNTTAQDLANTKDKDGHSALHSAMFFGYFPTNTTIALLKTTINNQGASAWDSLYNRLKGNPTSVITLPPHLFQGNNELAITITEIAIQSDPALKSKAAIWLGQVLADAQNQRDRTTLTP